MSITNTGLAQAFTAATTRSAVVNTGPVTGSTFTPSVAETMAYSQYTMVDSRWQKEYASAYRDQMKNRMSQISERLKQAFEQMLRRTMTEDFNGLATSGNISTNQTAGYYRLETEGALMNSQTTLRLGAVWQKQIPISKSMLGAILGSIGDFDVITPNNYAPVPGNRTGRKVRGQFDTWYTSYANMSNKDVGGVLETKVSTGAFFSTVDYMKRMGLATTVTYASEVQQDIRNTSARSWAGANSPMIPDRNGAALDVSTMIKRLETGRDAAERQSGDVFASVNEALASCSNFASPTIDNAGLDLVAGGQYNVQSLQFTPTSIRWGNFDNDKVLKNAATIDMSQVSGEVYGVKDFSYNVNGGSGGWTRDPYLYDSTQDGVGANIDYSDAANLKKFEGSIYDNPMSVRTKTISVSANGTAAVAAGSGVVQLNVDGTVNDFRGIPAEFSDAQGLPIKIDGNERMRGYVRTNFVDGQQDMTQDLQNKLALRAFNISGITDVAENRVDANVRLREVEVTDYKARVHMNPMFGDKQLANARTTITNLEAGGELDSNPFFDLLNEVLNDPMYESMLAMGVFEEVHVKAQVSTPNGNGLSSSLLLDFFGQSAHGNRDIKIRQESFMATSTAQ